MTVKRDCTCTRVRHVHGTRAAYQQDACRCFPCRAANSRAKAVWQNGGQYIEALIPATGVQNRLRALYALGWTWEAIAQRLDISRQAAYSASTGRRRGLATRSFARRVEALYDELSMTVPAGVQAHRARLNAARKGWVPPLAWDDDGLDDPHARPAGLAEPHARRPVDEVAVERAMRGEPVPLTSAERAEALRRLNAAGLSARQIADRLHTTRRTVTRRRAA